MLVRYGLEEIPVRFLNRKELATNESKNPPAFFLTAKPKFAFLRGLKIAGAMNYCFWVVRGLESDFYGVKWGS